MQEDRRTLIDRYELKDIAIKVVGVGSVGTFCAVALMMASEQDPLFLQVKEARASVRTSRSLQHGSVCSHCSRPCCSRLPGARNRPTW